MNKEDEAVRKAGRALSIQLPPGGRAVIVMHVNSPSFVPATTVLQLEESDLERATVVLTGWIPNVVAEVDGKMVPVGKSWQTVENGVELVWMKPKRPNPAGE